MMDLTKKQWVKHTVMHPFEGYEDLRWKDGGSVKYSFIIVLLLFVAQVMYDRLYGFQFYVTPDKLFNVIPYLVQSVIVFAVWVVGNWAISTLLDGEGTLKNICIFSAYALIPYIVQTLVNVFLSHFLVRDEYIFIQAIQVIGTLWSIILMFMAIKTVHQFSVMKTIADIILTICAMAIILFLIVLLLSLFQQVYVFAYSVYTEIAYRLKV
jgi:hypothetical protein